jgi:peptide/nickel transport system substrate-binding protein
MVLGLAVLLTACGGGGGTSNGNNSGGGSTTASFAERPGSPPVYIFPLNPAAYFTFANDEQFDYLLYPPLYWIDRNGGPFLNNQESLAQPARFSVDAKHQTVATIVLKKYRWSDGTPVTSRDIEFWMNLLVANKAQWGDYVPHQFPDNVVTIKYPSSSRVVITFDKVYNHSWLQLNELDQIFPIPQHVWDKTAMNGKVGNYDRTKKGAVAVRNFLNAQSKQGTAYVTNPLWKVVDGPWKISQFEPSTGYAAFAKNSHYSGPFPGNITKFVEMPFTSTSAELNAVRSGSVDYGYLPVEDVTSGQKSALRSQGYNLVPWNIWGWNYWPINFAQPTAGPIFKQLYVRQALQHLFDQKTWITQFLRGFGTPEYSAIPTAFKTPYTDSAVTTDHYPYSPQAAAQLLRSHGWKVAQGGSSTCTNPGSSPTQCGPGVRAGAQMNFTLEYSSGDPTLSQEVLAYKSAASQAGIRLSLVARPFSTVFADFFSCLGAPASSCKWQMLAPSLSDLYGWYPDYYPVGAANWKTGAVFNGQQYSDPKLNRLLEQAHEKNGLSSLRPVEDYVALNLPELWAPNGPFQISAIKKTLHVPLPQGSMTNIYPQFWTSK